MKTCENAGFSKPIAQIGGKRAKVQVFYTNSLKTRNMRRKDVLLQELFMEYSLKGERMHFCRNFW